MWSNGIVTYSKKVLGSNPMTRTSVRGLHVFPMSACSGFLPHSIDQHVGLNCDYNLAVSVNVGAAGCFSLQFNSVTD